MKISVTPAARQQPLLQLVALCDVRSSDPFYALARPQESSLPMDLWYRLTPPLLPERAELFYY